MLSAKIKMIAAVGMAAGIFWSGWSVNNYRWQARYSQLETEHAAQINKINQEYINDVNVMAEAADTLRAEIAAKDKAHYEQFEHARNQNAELRRVIADGSKRLSVITAQNNRQACLPGTASNPGMDASPARAELDPAFAERIVAIANDGDEAIRQLTALQAVCTMKTKTQ